MPSIYLEFCFLRALISLTYLWSRAPFRLFPGDVSDILNSGSGLRVRRFGRSLGSGSGPLCPLVCAVTGWDWWNACNDPKSAIGRNRSRCPDAYGSRLSNKSQSLPFAPTLRLHKSILPGVWRNSRVTSQFRLAGEGEASGSVTHLVPYHWSVDASLRKSEVRDAHFLCCDLILPNDRPDRPSQIQGTYVSKLGPPGGH